MILASNVILFVLKLLKKNLQFDFVLSFNSIGYRY